MLGRVLVAILIASAALAAPAVEKRHNQNGCVNPLMRRAWHTLSNDQKKAYLDAELCLMKTPAKLGLRGARTRFDEFQSVHVYQSEIAHFVGQFFPFHRLYVWAHEQALRNECGYTGAQPYWEESLDAGSFTKSIIFTADFGFGGDGMGDSLCIQSGPFANYTNPLGPGYKLADHCIERRLNDFLSQNASKEIVDSCLKKDTYLDFWNCVETRPHGAGHGGVGAEMSNPVSSPGDPLFYLHHTWLDRMWAKWQAKDPAFRLAEIGGHNTAQGPVGIPGFEPPPGSPFAPGLMPPTFGDPKDNIRPADVPKPMVIGDPGNETTLTHLIQMYNIVPNRTVAEVMNIQGELLCYDYD